MAGEIEEPFALDFRVDSGSISFGRFESEVLCWERRSSFLHNRYLEEVEKCSKPGSVTEKKAYFEAQFRKKGFPVLTSPECPDDKVSQKEISDDEEIDHINASAQFDQSLDGLDNSKLFAECETRVDKVDGEEPGTILAINFESEIQTKDNLDCEKAYSNTCLPFPDDHVNEGASTVPQQTSLPKKNSTLKPDHTKPKLVTQVSPGPNRKNSLSTTSKGSINKANDKVLDDQVRSKAEKKTSGEPHRHHLLHKTTKYEGGSETKGVDKTKSGEREVRSRSRTIVKPQGSTSQKVPSAAYQNANRVKPAVGVSKTGTRHDIAKSSMKDAAPSSIQARKQHSGSSIPGIRLSKSSQSGIDQTTTTVASSSARTTKVKASQAGSSSLAISRKHGPEKEKPTSLPEGNQISKGKQKTRNERSRYASFNNSSSRAGHMAVGVVS